MEPRSSGIFTAFYEHPRPYGRRDRFRAAAPTTVRGGSGRKDDWDDFREVWLSDYSHRARFRIYSTHQSPDRSPDRS
jgi:hypothetical protein